MTIREATPADIPTLAHLATKTWLDAFGDEFDEEERNRRVAKHRSEKYFEGAFKRDVIYVAEDEGVLIGYAEFGPPDIAGIEPIEGDMEISRLYVLADFQRQGIGRKLLGTIFTHPLMQNAQNIYLDVLDRNTDAIRLYESYGFVNTGKRDVEGDLIMMKTNTR